MINLYITLIHFNSSKIQSDDSMGIHKEHIICNMCNVHCPLSTTWNIQINRIIFVEFIVLVQRTDLIHCCFSRVLKDVHFFYEKLKHSFYISIFFSFSHCLKNICMLILYLIKLTINSIVFISTIDDIRNTIFLFRIFSFEKVNNLISRVVVY